MSLRLLRSVGGVLICLSVCLSQDLFAKIVAVVEGTPITDIDVRKEVAQQGAKRGTTIEEKKKYREALESLIQQELLFKEAKQSDVTVTHEDREKALNSVVSRFPSEGVFKEALSKEGMTYDQFVDSMEKRILITKFCQRHLSLNLYVTSQEIEDYYASHLEEFHYKKQVKVKQIYVAFRNETEKEFAWSKVESYHQTLTSREIKFEEVVIEEEDAQVNDLGFVSEGQLTEILDEIAFSLRLGEVSNIIEGEEGYHIIKVEAIKEPKILNLGEVKDSIKKRLMIQKEKSLIDSLVKSIREKSYVELKS